MLGLFIGAGASYEVGMPLVDELSNTVRRNVIKRLNTKLFNFSAVPSLRLKLTELLENHDYNYEQVLGELEKAYYADRKSTQATWGVIIQLIECVQLLLLEDQKNTLPLFEQKIKDYKGIKALIANNSSLNVFSLNHDIVFEELCSYYQIPLRDGFYERDNEYQNVAKFRVITKAEIEAGQFSFFEKNEAGINLLKLHGSIDFFAANDKEIFLKSYGNGHQFGSHFDEIIKIENHNLSIANTDKLRMVNELGVYDRNGELQFLRRSLLSGAHKFRDQNSQIVPLELLNLFRRKLDEINELVVIGYGFGDTHINEVLCRWLKDESRKLKIYDPFRKDIPGFLQANCKQITIVNAGLTDYFASHDASTEPLENPNIVSTQEIREQLRIKRLAVEPIEKQKAAS